MTGSTGGQHGGFAADKPLCLIVKGPGSRADSASAEAEEQCREYGLEPVRRTIVAVSAMKVDLFPNVMAFLPDDPGDSMPASAAVGDFRQMMQDYSSVRARLRDALSGEREWWEVGIFQLGGYASMLGLRPIREIRQRCCDDVHRLDGADKLDMFRIYRTGKHLLTVASAEPHVDGDEIAAAAIREAAMRVQRWSVQPQQGPAVLDIIEAARRHFENPRATAMHRPLRGVNRNRLALILDGIPEEAQTTYKDQLATESWQSTDARVWRTVEKKIREKFPDFSFPNPTGRTNAVRAFREFYDDLNTIDETYRTGN